MRAVRAAVRFDGHLGAELNARVDIASGLTTADKLAAFDALFPVAGAYAVGVLNAPLAKATVGGEDTDEFENWWLQLIEDRARQEFVSARDAMWGTLETLLHERGVKAPSALAHQQLQQTLFDVSTAATARLVGVTVPAAVVERLGKIGFTSAETIDFPAIAYRAQLISARLATQAPVAWPELVRLATQAPLSSAERATIEYARNRAGLWLQPVFDESGRVWSAQREIEPLRRILADGTARRKSTQEMVRQLEASQRGQGVTRDARRVCRSEIAEARGQAAWQQVRKGTTDDDRFFRQTSAHPCRGCLRLLKNPAGTPRLFTRAELDAGEAMGLNRGSWQHWHLRAGGLHPNCVCGPVEQFHSAMVSIFSRRAPEFAAMIRNLKVFEEKEAA